MAQKNSLDKFVGQNLWVKVIISGKDKKFYYRPRRGALDTLWYVKLLRMDADRDYFIMNAIVADTLAFDPQNGTRFISAYDVDCSLRTESMCTRSLTQIAQPIEVMTTEELLDCIERIKDEDI